MNGKLILREIQINDIPKIKEIRDYCLEFLDTPTSYTLEQTQNWLECSKPDWKVIEVHDKIAGYIRTSDYNKIHHTMYIGADLHPNFRGFGYAFQAYQKAMEQYKIEKNIRKFYLKVQISNYRAYNLYRKLGFTSIGIIPQALILPGKGFMDQVLMYKDV